MLAGNRCNSILQPNLASTNVKSKAGVGRDEGRGRVPAPRDSAPAAKLAETTPEAQHATPGPLPVAEEHKGPCVGT